MPGPKSWKALLDRFERAGFELRNVHTVVVTHSHIDHFGASGRLREQAGAKVVTALVPHLVGPDRRRRAELEAVDGDTDIECRRTRAGRGTSRRRGAASIRARRCRLASGTG